MNTDKLIGIIFSATLVTWVLYFILTPFLKFISESYRYELILSMFEYIIIAEYTCIALIMIYTLRDEIRNVRHDSHLIKQWRQEPQTFMLQDVSAELRELKHPIALDYKKQVEALGFQRLGEAENIYFINYVFTNEDSSIMAVIRPRKPQHVDMFFESVFADDFTLVTGYKSVLNRDADDLQQRMVDASIDKTYTFHLQQLEIQRLQHGQPVLIETIEQTVHYGQEHNKRYLELEFGTVQRSQIVGLILAILVTVSLFVGIYGLLNHNNRLASLPVVAFILMAYIATKFFPEMNSVKFDKRKSKAQA